MYVKLQQKAFFQHFTIRLLDETMHNFVLHELSSSCQRNVAVTLKMMSLFLKVF